MQAPDTHNRQHFLKAEETQFLEGKHNLFHEGTQEQVHEPEEAPVLAMLMANVVNNCVPGSGQCNCKQGVRLCTNEAEAVAEKEI